MHRRRRSADLWFAAGEGIHRGVEQVVLHGPLGDRDAAGAAAPVVQPGLHGPLHQAAVGPGVHGLRHLLLLPADLRRDVRRSAGLRAVPAGQRVRQDHRDLLRLSVGDEVHGAARAGDARPDRRRLREHAAHVRGADRRRELHRHADVDLLPDRAGHRRHHQGRRRPVEPGRQADARAGHEDDVPLRVLGRDPHPGAARHVLPLHRSRVRLLLLRHRAAHDRRRRPGPDVPRLLRPLHRLPLQGHEERRRARGLPHAAGPGADGAAGDPLVLRDGRGRPGRLPGADEGDRALAATTAG